MIQDRTVFIIPGFRHRPTNKAYKAIATLLENEGYSPILITIPWKKTTISENTAYFLEEYKKIRAKKKYILGFSFGAMIAFLAATHVSASGVILCSLSPYFKEDVTKGKKGLLSHTMKRRHEDFLQLECATLAKQIKAKQILMLYGKKEAKSLIHRVTQAFALTASRNKHLVPIQKAEHNIGDKRYLTTIHQVAKTLQ